MKWLTRLLAPIFRIGYSKSLSGKAYVTDGDGIRLKGYEIRLVALDAPEHGQPAKSRQGYWFDHGKHVKSALINKIGGKYVTAKIEGKDKYKRLLGTVYCDGEDINAWLVSEGHAIACYGDRYKSIEKQAKKARLGMWAHKFNYDPRYWRAKGKKNAGLK